LSQLILSTTPGFSDLPDTALAAGEVLTDATVFAISHNAKFAAVRGKLRFMGFYAHGNTVGTPIDPDDGYVYARSECQYIFMPYSNRAPAPGFIPGQAAPPAQSSSQPGPLYNWPGGWAINDATGLVTLWTTYEHNGNEVVNNDGIIKVYAICLRRSVTARPSGPGIQEAPAEPIPSAPIPAPAPTLPAGTVVGTVSLSQQTASLGSAASPVTIFTVGASVAEFAISFTADVNVLNNEVLNSEGNPAEGMVMVVVGWTNSGTPEQADDLSITAASDTAGGYTPGSRTAAFSGAPETTIWYYTIWTVDPEIAAQSSYDLSISLKQMAS
jgi:hypothetical protein